MLEIYIYLSCIIILAVALSSAYTIANRDKYKCKAEHKKAVVVREHEHMRGSFLGVHW